MPKTIKTAVSIPVETYRKAEALRSLRGVSRSRFVSEAIEAYLAREATAELEARDEAAYRRQPESAKDASAWLKAGMTSWGPKAGW